MIRQLTADFPFSCNPVAVAGIEPQVLLLNFHQINRRATIVRGQTIERLQLNHPHRGFVLRTTAKGITARVQSVTDKSRPTAYEHSLTIRLLDTSLQTRSRLTELSQGVFVAIIQTKRREFELLGYHAGLIATAINRDYTTADGSFLITLKTHEVKEPHLPYLWNEASEGQNRTLEIFNRQLTDKTPQGLPVYGVGDWESFTTPETACDGDVGLWQP